MIAPIQQNKPNIEIFPNTFNVSTVIRNRMYVVNQFSYHDIYGSTDHYGLNLGLLYTNIDVLYRYNADVTFSTDNQLQMYITDDDFYISSVAPYVRNDWRSIAIEYYKRTRGGTPTSENFGFTTGTSYLPTNSSYYTYTLSGVQGTMTGRIYVPSTNAFNVVTNTSNSSVTINAGSTFQQIIQQMNINLVYENSATNNNKVLYYYTTSNPNLNNAGTISIPIYARNIYGYSTFIRTVSVTIVADTTPPTITSITGNPTNWTNQSATITVQATDNVALNSSAYSFNGGSTWQQSNQLTTNINQTLQIRVRDTSGNIASQDIVLNRFDITDPAINLAGNWKNTFEIGELTNNNDLLSYLSISDSLSGINSSLTVLQNFNYNVAGAYSNIQVSATDNAGNTNVFTLPTVTITQPADTTGPIISGPTQITRTINALNSPTILDLFTISDISGVQESRIQTTDGNINWQNTIITTGSYQLRVYARDTLNNITLYQFTLIVEPAPVPDTTPPQIIGPLLVSFEIGTYLTNTEILNLYTYQDNVAILQTQLIGTIDYESLGDYQVQIKAIDTSNNETIKYVTIRIRDELTLGNYNPLTDLLSGIFGAGLSMIFTIGTVNVLGFRLLDGMAIIILGAIILFVYKAIKGGS